MNYACLLGALASHIALAQPGEEPPPPTESTPDPQPAFLPPSDDGPPPVDLIAQGYPRALTQRPLITPRGVLEGIAFLRLESFGFSGADEGFLRGVSEPAIRYGFGAGDVEVGASFVAYHSEPDTGGVGGPVQVETLQSVYAVGRFTVADETAIVGQFVALAPAADSVSTYSPGVFIQHKAHLSRVTALEVSGGLNYAHSVYDETLMVDAIDQLDVVVRIRAQVQLHPILGLEARAEYHDVTTLDNDDAGQQVSNDYRRQSYGLVGTFSATPILDVIGGVEVLQSGDSYDHSFGIGLLVRMVP